MTNVTELYKIGNKFKYEPNTKKTISYNITNKKMH